MEFKGMQRMIEEHERRIEWEKAHPLTEQERNLRALRRMKEECEHIERATARFGKSRERFLADDIYHNSVCMSLFYIAGLSGDLTAELRATNPAIPWESIIQLEKSILHHYESMDFSAAWDIVINDIPTLQAFCAGILDTERN